MKIEQFNQENKGYFLALDGDIEAGRMTYSWAGNDKFIIDHTDVNPNYKGKNIGKQMIMKAVEFARENKILIIPLCPFAQSVFEKVDEIKDVLV